MIKTILIILLTVITAASGNYFANALKRRSDGLALAVYMVSEMKDLIEYRSATVYEILSYLCNDSRFDDLSFLKEAEKLCEDKNISFGEAWEKSVCEKTPAFFKQSDTKLIRSIGKDIGKSVTEGQINGLSLKQKELERLNKEAESLYASKAKLYRSLGVLSGAFIAVIMI